MSPSRMLRVPCGLLWLLAYGLAVGVAAEESRVDFSRDIRPLLSENCYQCHGPNNESREAELRLDTEAGALKPLESDGFALVRGDSSKSQLYQRLIMEDVDERMPPPDSRKSLTGKQIELIKKWIEQGAPWQKHWSFVKPQRPRLPDVKHADSVRNPIDRFVLARLQAEGLRPAPEADRPTLIRRVTLDLTGLPPTPAEVDAFVADTSPDAYQKLVDRLLASPHYGQHMARYWLDAARYGDTHGLHLDNERSLWPYRDWVIDAFNKNIPFDQFTVEQLAGDLLPIPTQEQLIATGFHRCNATTSEGGSINEEFLVRYAVDRVETTAMVWLGLTAGCAVCHEHKYDPISQKEFYQLFAFFNSLTEKAMDGNALLPPPVIGLPSPKQTEQLTKLDSQIKEMQTRLDTLTPQVDAAQLEWEKQWAGKPSSLGSTVDKNDKILALAPILSLPTKQRSEEQKKQLREFYRANFAPAWKKANQRIGQLRKQQVQIKKTIPSTMVMRELDKRRDAFVLIRGAYDKKGEQVQPGVPAVFPPLPQGAPANRLGLARWLVDPANPLTSRVTVNRFWQQYFGVGLVKTSEDFGSQGQWPSHPRLLDWLATQLIASGWDVKHLQRLIVTSATYRQSSHVSEESYRKDPENRLLARGSRFRMDAEMVRDNALAISGLLENQFGGHGVKPYQPPGLWKEVGYPGSNTSKFVQDHGDALYRRTIYTFWKRTSPPPALVTFDAPTRESCIARRSRTNTPLQALVLMNDVPFVEAARYLAQRMMTEGGEKAEDRLTFAFRRATARLPRPDEMQVLLHLYQQHLKRYQQDQEAARKLVGVGEAARDESLDVSQLAAWTMVANLILNLDETVTKG